MKRNELSSNRRPKTEPWRAPKVPLLLSLRPVQLFRGGVGKRNSALHPPALRASRTAGSRQCASLFHAEPRRLNSRTRKNEGNPGPKKRVVLAHVQAQAADKTSGREG